MIMRVIIIASYFRLIATVSFFVAVVLAVVVGEFGISKQWRPVTVLHDDHGKVVWYIESISEAFEPINKPMVDKIDYSLPTGYLVRYREPGFNSRVAWNNNRGIAQAYLMDRFIVVELPTKYEQGKKVYEIFTFILSKAPPMTELETMDSWMYYYFPNGHTQYSWEWTPGEEDPRDGEGRLLITKYV